MLSITKKSPKKIEMLEFSKININSFVYVDVSEPNLDIDFDINLGITKFLDMLIQIFNSTAGKLDIKDSVKPTISIEFIIKDNELQTVISSRFLEQFNCKEILGEGVFDNSTDMQTFTVTKAINLPLLPRSEQNLSENNKKSYWEIPLKIETIPLIVPEINIVSSKKINLNMQQKIVKNDDKDNLSNVANHKLPTIKESGDIQLQQKETHQSSDKLSSLKTYILLKDFEEFLSKQEEKNDELQKIYQVAENIKEWTEKKFFNNNKNTVKKFQYDTCSFYFLKDSLNFIILNNSRNMACDELTKEINKQFSGADAIKISFNKIQIKYKNLVIVSQQKTRILNTSESLQIQELNFPSEFNDCIEDQITENLDENLHQRQIQNIKDLKEGFQVIADISSTKTDKKLILKLIDNQIVIIANQENFFLIKEYAKSVEFQFNEYINIDEKYLTFTLIGDFLPIEENIDYKVTIIEPNKEDKRKLIELFKSELQNKQSDNLFSENKGIKVFSGESGNTTIKNLETFFGKSIGSVGNTVYITNNHKNTQKNIVKNKNNNNRSNFTKDSNIITDFFPSHEFGGYEKTEKDNEIKAITIEELASEMNVDTQYNQNGDLIVTSKTPNLLTKFHDQLLKQLDFFEDIDIYVLEILNGELIIPQSLLQTYNSTILNKDYAF